MNLKNTRLLVSVQSPECSDCFLRFMSSNNIKKFNEIKQNENFFFLKIEIFLMKIIPSHAI